MESKMGTMRSPVRYSGICTLMVKCSNYEVGGASIMVVLMKLSAILVLAALPSYYYLKYRLWKKRI